MPLETDEENPPYDGDDGQFHLWLQSPEEVGALHLGQIFDHSQDDCTQRRSATAAELKAALGQSFMEAGVHEAFQKRELVGVVIVKGSAIDSRLGSYVAD